MRSSRRRRSVSRHQASRHFGTPAQMQRRERVSRTSFACTVSSSHHVAAGSSASVGLYGYYGSLTDDGDLATSPLAYGGGRRRSSWSTVTTTPIRRPTRPTSSSTSVRCRPTRLCTPSFPAPNTPSTSSTRCVSRPSSTASRRSQRGSAAHTASPPMVDPMARDAPLLALGARSALCVRSPRRTSSGSLDCGWADSAGPSGKRHWSVVPPRVGGWRPAVDRSSEPGTHRAGPRRPSSCRLERPSAAVWPARTRAVHADRYAGDLAAPSWRSKKPAIHRLDVTWDPGLGRHTLYSFTGHVHDRGRRRSPVALGGGESATLFGQLLPGCGARSRVVQKPGRGLCVEPPLA